MKIIMLSESRLDELVELALARMFKNTNTQVHDTAVTCASVQYHMCHLKEEIKRTAL